MAFLVSIDDTRTLVALKTHLIILSHDAESTTHELNAELPVLPTSKPCRFLPDTEEPEAEVPVPDQPFQIVNIAVGAALLAVSATDKTLFLFEIAGTELTFKSRRKLARNTSALRFFPDNRQLLVSDKTGDVFVFDCEDFEKAGRWILGHISQVLDVAVDSAQKFVLSCDRDEKIRVTRYPETFEIQGFCLGHKEFVSSIQLFKDQEKEYMGE